MSAVNPVAPQPPPARLLTLLASGILAILTALIYAVLFIATPSFSKLFAGFGGDLPTLTAVFLAFGHWFLVLGIVGFLPFVMLGLNRQVSERTRILLISASVGSFLLSLFVFAAWVVACYLPIWKMGAVI
ncbi:MAG: hypothetical protein AAGA44_00875 [Pseudomonadota bacterium]